MNKSGATSILHHSGGWIGMFSPFWTSKMWPVRDEEGKQIIFNDRWKAETAAWRQLYATEQRVQGALINTRPRHTAESLFKQGGNGNVTGKPTDNDSGKKAVRGGNSRPIASMALSGGRKRV